MLCWVGGRLFGGPRAGLVQTPIHPMLWRTGAGACFCAVRTPGTPPSSPIRKGLPAPQAFPAPGLLATSTPLHRQLQAGRKREVSKSISGSTRSQPWHSHSEGCQASSPRRGPTGGRAGTVPPPENRPRRSPAPGAARWSRFKIQQASAAKSDRPVPAPAAGPGGGCPAQPRCRPRTLSAQGEAPDRHGVPTEDPRAHPAGR